MIANVINLAVRRRVAAVNLLRAAGYTVVAPGEAMSVEEKLARFELAAALDTLDERLDSFEGKLEKAQGEQAAALRHRRGEPRAPFE